MVDALKTMYSGLVSELAQENPQSRSHGVMPKRIDTWPCQIPGDEIDVEGQVSPAI